MNKIKKLLKRKTTWIIFILFVLVYVNNSSFFAKRDEGKPLLLAHRGLSQTFSMEELRGIRVQQNVYMNLNILI